MSKPLSQALVRQWHPTLKGVLRWQDIPANSSVKIWWQCEKGHAWASAARNRTRGPEKTICKRCFRQLRASGIRRATRC